MLGRYHFSVAHEIGHWRLKLAAIDRDHPRRLHKRLRAEKLSITFDYFCISLAEASGYRLRCQYAKKITAMFRVGRAAGCGRLVGPAPLKDGLDGPLPASTRVI